MANKFGSRSGWYGHDLTHKRKGVYREHTERLGPPSEFGYHDFIPLFKAEEFDVVGRLYDATYPIPVERTRDNSKVQTAPKYEGPNPGPDIHNMYLHVGSFFQTAVAINASEEQTLNYELPADPRGRQATELPTGSQMTLDGQATELVPMSSRVYVIEVR